MAGYYFNLPQITQLTIAQQTALNETKPIALSGGPGTGKSVVSLWRHLSNYKQNKISLLLTYTTTLAKYLSACCKSQNQNAANNVKTSLRGKPRIGSNWHEIIVDEAQDLPISYYNEIKSIANVSYGADDSQILYPECCSKRSELRSLFISNVDYDLDKNFRSTKRIMQLAKTLFQNAYIPQSMIDGLTNNIGELPVFLISNGNKFDKTNSKQNKSIIEIINSFRSDTHNIAILVPWKSDAELFETVLKENNMSDFSIYYEDATRFSSGCGEIKNIHLTTFKSAKGLEFDTVIIPNFNKYLEICGNFNITWQDYYVAITRARSNLYLISNYDISLLNSVTDKSIL
jgi:superfamily I DNA/RNA helicase